MSQANPNVLQSYMGYVKIDTSILAYAQSFSLNIPREVQKIQAIGMKSTKKIAGPYDWTASSEALEVLTQDASAGNISADDLIRLHLTDGTKVDLAFEPNTTDVSTGQFYLSGSAIISNISVNVPVGTGATTFSADFEGDGDLDISHTG